MGRKISTKLKTMHSFAEVAEFLGVQESYVHTLIHKHELPVDVKFDPIQIYNWSQLRKQYLASQKKARKYGTAIAEVKPAIEPAFTPAVDGIPY